MDQSKKKSKKKTVVLITAIATLAVIAGGFYVYTTRRAVAASGMDAVTPTKTMTLARRNVVESLGLSGTVLSENSENVYTTLNYPVKAVHVAVGDKVKAGDVLAILDISELDSDIAQARINLLNASKTTQENSQSSKNSVDSALISIETSKISLEKQRLSYDTLQSQLADGSHSDLVNAQNSIDSAKHALDAALKDVGTKTADYDSNKLLYDSGAISKSDMDGFEKALDNAQTAYRTATEDYDKAVANYDRIKAKLENDLLTSEKDLNNSEINLQKAQGDLAYAQSKANTTTSNVELQQLTLEKLLDERERIEIKAPIDGIVTEVNAVVGSEPKDILFVIQDSEDLYVSANVKEHKIGKVAVGQSAFITTEASGNAMFEGEVNFISPTAVDLTSTNVEFEVHIHLNNPDQSIKIGMNASLNIILNAKENTYAVPYDAIVYSRGQGSSVYALEDKKVIEIPVTTGIDDDSYIAIEGEKLQDGLPIITNPTDVTLGQIIETTTDVTSPGQGMMMRQTAPGSGGEALSGEQEADGGALPADGEIPEGAQMRRIEGGQMPEGGEIPEGAQMRRIEGGQMPEGGEIPEGAQMRRMEGGQMPEGGGVSSGAAPIGQ